MRPSTSSIPPRPPALGIGLITYSRLDTLKECLRSIEQHTRTPYHLVIADDGSRDGTVEWARHNGYRTITGARRGCAWNKNRALYHLLTRSDCDPILLLEDDTFPNEPGWESRWIEAADRWQHVNYCPAPPGSETPEEPMQCIGFGGQCTVTTRNALEQIGYLDARFVGYGYEHVEWTHRFRWQYDGRWGLLPGTVPCLTRGVSVDWTHSWYDADEMLYNDRIYRMIRAEPLYRHAWHCDEERRIIEHEIGAASVPAVDGVLCGDLAHTT